MALAIGSLSSRFRWPGWSAIYACIRGHWFYMRVLALLGGVLLFYLMRWDWLQVLYAKAIEASIASFSVADGVERSGHVLSLPGHPRFVVTPECTYVDWLICVMPWWLGLGTRARATAVFFLFSAAVIALNIARISASILASLSGWSWFWAHDLLDYLTWYPSLCIVIFALIIYRINSGGELK